MIVVIQATDNEVVDVLFVKNYDETFPRKFADAEMAWNETDEEFGDFIYSRLRGDGYLLEVVPDESIVLFQASSL